MLKIETLPTVFARLGDKRGVCTNVQIVHMALFSIKLSTREIIRPGKECTCKIFLKCKQEFMLNFNLYLRY